MLKHYPSYLGMAVHVVEPGTEIEQNGKIMIVTKSTAVIRSRNIYCSQEVYDTLKESSVSSSSA